MRQEGIINRHDAVALLVEGGVVVAVFIHPFHLYYSRLREADSIIDKRRTHGRTWRRFSPFTHSPPDDLRRFRDIGLSVSRREKRPRAGPFYSGLRSTADAVVSFDSSSYGRKCGLGWSVRTRTSFLGFCPQGWPMYREDIIFDFWSRFYGWVIGSFGGLRRYSRKDEPPPVFEEGRTSGAGRFDARDL